MGAFRDALERASFGVFDSFFDLGGHSLMALRVMLRLRVASGFDLPLRNLFERPTVRANPNMSRPSISFRSDNSVTGVRTPAEGCAIPLFHRRSGFATARASVLARAAWHVGRPGAGRCQAGTAGFGHDRALGTCAGLLLTGTDLDQIPL
jgi:phosphopantetheine binding protein